MQAEEGLFSTLEPEDFVARGFRRYLARLEARPSKRPKRAPLPAVKRLKACYGQSFPELERLDKVLSEASFLDTPGMTEWTPEIWAPVIEPEKGKNLAEALITWAQEKWPALLEELFGGAVALGCTRSGDLWLYGLYDSPSEPDRHAVHLWDHATGRIKSTVAADLDSFALAHVLMDQVSEGAIRSKVAARVAELLSGRVCFAWPFDRVLEKLIQGKPRACPTGHQTAEYASRAAWIKVALLGEPGSIIRREFEPALNLPMDPKKWSKAVAGATAVPPTALYLMFRAFLFGQNERLTAALATFSKSPVPLVRDAAALMGELQKGRKELGQILDVQALQKEVIALCLDPDLEPLPEKKAKAKKAKAKKAKVGKAAGRTQANP
ncbi:MAG TPA: hypothetical protein VGK67_00300 [Myxococcales bacterium]|jgi:hypothetical protein